MKISVIVPVYKVEKFVSRCMESIINQTMTKGVECIIVNDCTPDKSMEIVQQRLADYHGNIQFKIINHERNRGVVTARNTGLFNTTGDYIIHIDSDDYCEPDMLEKLYEEAVDKDADIVGCDFFIDNGKSKQLQTFNFLAFPEYNLRELIEGHYWGVIWTRLIRRDLYTKNKLNFIDKLDYGGEFIMLVKLHYYAEKVAYVSKPLYNYVKYNTQSITYSLNMNKIDQRVRTHRIMETFLKEHDIYDLYKISFLKSCFWAKLPLLYDKNVQDLKLWKSIYPESNKYISQYDYTFLVKQWLILLSYLPTRIGRMLLSLKDMIKYAIIHD